MHHIHSYRISRRDDEKCEEKKNEQSVRWWYNRNICFHSEANFCKLLSAFTRASSCWITFVFSVFFFLLLLLLLHLFSLSERDFTIPFCSCAMCTLIHSRFVYFVYSDSLFTFLVLFLCLFSFFYGFIGCTLYTHIPFAHFSRMHFNWGRPKVRAMRLVTYATTHTQNTYRLVWNVFLAFFFHFVV